MNRQSIENRTATGIPAPARPAPLASLALIGVLSMACYEASDPTALDAGAPPAAVEEGLAPVNATSMDHHHTHFKVRIENVSPVYDFLVGRGFNRPWNVSQPGPLLPGQSYAFTFDAHAGHRLSFATMFVQSNDLFYAPSDEGIELWTEDGRTEGDITDQILLWDAGTEVNQEPGSGADQPLRGGNESGEADDDGTVRLADDEFGNLPEVADVIRVTLESLGATTFRLEIENVSGEMTLKTADGAYHPTPLAPGVFVVHTAPYPLFEEGEADYGQGLEALAEDGVIGALVESVAARTGLTTPLAPGVFVAHPEPGGLFVAGEHASPGMEALAEDGNPEMLSAEVQARFHDGGMGANEGSASDGGSASTGSSASGGNLAGGRHDEGHPGGVFAVPVGEENAGPLFPGQAYEFMVTAEAGDYLSFATMFVQSNDLFYAPSDRGIALFPNGLALEGDITDLVELWDAGTEFNERPGVGLGQAPRQAAANTGPEEARTVELLDPYFRYPAVSDVIKVTIYPVMH